jgi:hypothetical protein
MFKDIQKNYWAALLVAEQLIDAPSCYLGLAMT